MKQKLRKIVSKEPGEKLGGQMVYLHPNFVSILLQLPIHQTLLIICESSLTRNTARKPLSVYPTYKY